MDVLSIIKKLSEYPSVSGFELVASKRAAALINRYTDKLSTDSFGNVIGYRKSGKRGAKCLLLDAHIDEIGLIVTGEKDGFLTFSNIGGVDPRILPGARVIVLCETPKNGVITSTPPHLQAENEDETIEMKDLFIDIGAEEDDEKIPVGTPVVFDSGYAELQGKNVSAGALDDRAGIAAIILALDMLKGKKLAIDIAVLASVQEELGCRGAGLAAYGIKPDWALVVDVTHAQTPGVDKSLTFAAGSGAAIGVGPNMTKKVSDALLEIAKEKKIPHTVEVSPAHSGTNAWSIQTLREGIATGVISIPLKYMHTPVETVMKKDIEAVAKLIFEFVLNLSAGGGKL